MTCKDQILVHIEMGFYVKVKSLPTIILKTMFLCGLKKENNDFFPPGIIINKLNCTK